MRVGIALDGAECGKVCSVCPALNIEEKHTTPGKEGRARVARPPFTLRPPQSTDYGLFNMSPGKHQETVPRIHAPYYQGHTST